MTVLNDFTREDLNDDLKLVADNCGLNVALTLLQNLSGITITIPKNGYKNLERNYIMKSYQAGERVNNIALKVNLTKKQVYNIINKGRK